ncbi:MAG: DUF1289 domain-containing protein [Rhodospirillaceae bacterium]|nr:DUF1289 domain-containing protein [Rhodospirillaceae bacterium]
MTVRSPCLLVCELDRTSGWCFGCGRSGEEVENWLAYSDGQRDAVIAALPARLTAMGLPPEGDQRIAEDKARAQKGLVRRQNRRRKQRA